MALLKSFKSIFLSLPGSRQKKDIFAFTLCFFVATAFWFLNRLNSNFTTTLSYPLEISYDRESYTFTRKLPDKLNVNISGFGWKILDKMYGFHKEPLTLNNESIFRNNFLSAKEIMPVLNQSFNEIKINSISPDTLYFSFDKRLVRKVPVILSSSLEFKPDFGLSGDPRVFPDSVIIEGASSMVNQIKSIHTKKITKNNLHEDFTLEVKLDFQEKQGIKISHTTIKIHFPIDEFIEQKKQIRFTRLNFPEQFSSDSTIPEFCNVGFRMPAKKLNEFSSDSFRLILDYRFIDPEKQIILPLVEHLPGYIHDFTIINPSIINVKDRNYR
ncbi:MAG: hypothetical protein A3H98_09475 [Bacteroidetes bacterium RIFCSPLOWO2_02_FULL_36_8]|nr:MAG: hypothetical protein A3H98_09475 [Bacteroidetes bacterium RIFCSPLOWO2_02_FULL_36_8]OFY71916.1 MAG: hypothetical protein A3G23_05185 [Bacteroidetes bacterium RIFCSPLOWO2_12_FULL_37_12]